MSAEVYARLVELGKAGEAFALGWVVGTRGSTPQKPGAQALFLRDGRVVGTVGGGCLEMETRRRALQALDDGKPCLFELHLDDDFGWDDGLICGGTARVFVQPFRSDQLGLFRRLLEVEQSGTPCVLATVIEGGSGELVGRRCLLGAGAVLAADLPDGLDTLLDEPAQRALETERPLVERVVGQGDHLEVYLEPHLPHPTLLIAGAGHIGQALASIGTMIGFNVVVVDDRCDFANRVRFPQAKEIIVDEIPETLARYPIDADTYVVIVTRGHRHDATALRACIGSPARYLGMIGSRRKIHLIFRELREGGYATEEQLERVRTPLGLDLGAVLVEEIAVSIAAELIAVRRRGDADVIQAMCVSHGVNSRAAGSRSAAGH